MDVNTKLTNTKRNEETGADIISTQKPDNEENEELAEDEVVAQVEEPQLGVKALNAKITNTKRNREAETDMISNITTDSRFVENRRNIAEKGKSAEDELDDKFKVVEIRSKTAEEEKKWLSGKFHEMREKSVIEEGASLKGRKLETISNSIPLPTPIKVGTSCVLKFSNHLNVPLAGARFIEFGGTKLTGPSVVTGHFFEVFEGSGDWCHFMCSFSISKSLRIVILSSNVHEGGIFFIIGFIPQNIPIDSDLHKKLIHMKLSPDFCYNPSLLGTKPAELFVTSGKFLVRGYFRTYGPRAFVDVDILDMTDSANGSLRNCELKSLSSDLKRTVEKISRSLKTNQEIPGKMSCSVEVLNLLNVTLRSGEIFYSSSERNSFVPSQLQPLEGTTFFASDDLNVEGMFSFEIETTDLCLVIAFKSKGNENRYAGAFLPCPAPKVSKEELDNLTSEKHWKSHEWRKSAQAKEGEQVLEIRNIRVVISMTEGEKSLLKIQVFAF